MLYEKREDAKECKTVENMEFKGCDPDGNEVIVIGGAQGKSSVCVAKKTEICPPAFSCGFNNREIISL